MPTTCTPSYAQEIAALKKLISCLIADIKEIREEVDPLAHKPPLYIEWDDIVENRYINEDSEEGIVEGVKFVLHLNGVKFLEEGVDYLVLDHGFQLINEALVNVPNTYVLIR